MKAIRTVLACLRKADQTYNLINHGDKIVVGLSGGKDSLLLTYALSLYKKFSHTDFEIQPVTLDLGFPNFDSTYLEEFCQSLGLTLKVVDSQEVYKILKANQGDSPHLPCSICSRMKKAAINKVANELGFNKVAFAHHADDAIETLFMNEIYGGKIATFAPKMFLENAKITFIRPFILVRESDITKAIREEHIQVNGSNCPADKHTMREEMKDILKEYYHKYNQAKNNFLFMLSNYEKEDLWGKEIEYQIDNEGLVLKPVTLPYEMDIVHKIRLQVFCVEQNVTIQDEILEDKDLENVHHFLIKYKGENVGTIRYRINEDGIILQRFAILKEYRQKGLGRKVFTFLVDEIISKKYNPIHIYFTAQYHLGEFYKSLGYQSVGEPFMEAGIKHILMEKYIK